MILIAHRGLLSGPNKELENHPDQIRKAVNLGFFAEVDVRSNDSGRLFLGHDAPSYPIEPSFFVETPNIIVHAKDLKTLSYFAQSGVHCFWHEEDTYTLTNRGWIWAYPDSEANGFTICVMPEVYSTRPDLKNYMGVCSDYILNIQKELNAN